MSEIKITVAGPSGSGKTFLLHLMAKTFHSLGLNAVIQTQPEYKSFQDQYDDMENNFEKRIDAINTNPILVEEVQTNRMPTVFQNAFEAAAAEEERIKLILLNDSKLMKFIMQQCWFAAQNSLTYQTDNKLLTTHRDVFDKMVLFEMGLSDENPITPDKHG